MAHRARLAPRIPKGKMRKMRNYNKAGEEEEEQATTTQQEQQTLVANEAAIIQQVRGLAAGGVPPRPWRCHAQPAACRGRTRRSCCALAGSCRPPCRSARAPPRGAETSPPRHHHHHRRHQQQRHSLCCRYRSHALAPLTLTQTARTVVRFESSTLRRPSTGSPDLITPLPLGSTSHNHMPFEARAASRCQQRQEHNILLGTLGRTL